MAGDRSDATVRRNANDSTGGFHSSYLYGSATVDSDDASWTVGTTEQACRDVGLHTVSGDCGELNVDFDFCGSTPNVDVSLVANRYSANDECDDYRMIIRRAWAMIYENLDIAEAAIDHLGYSSSFYSKFVSLVSDDEVEILCEDRDTTAHAYSIRNEIGIDNEYLETMLGHFQDNQGQVKKQACVVADLASTIAHEMFHLVGLGASMWDDTIDGLGDILGAAFWELFGSGTCSESYYGGECYDSYIFENYFRYYLMRRYKVLGFWKCNWSKASQGHRNANWQLLVCDDSDSQLGYGINRNSSCIKYSSDPSEEDTDCAEGVFEGSCR